MLNSPKELICFGLLYHLQNLDLLVYTKVPFSMDRGMQSAEEAASNACRGVLSEGRRSRRDRARVCPVPPTFRGSQEVRYWAFLP